MCVCACVDEIKAKKKNYSIVKYQSAAFWGQTKKYVSSDASHHVAGCIMHVKIIYYVIKMKDGEGKGGGGGGGRSRCTHADVLTGAQCCVGVELQQQQLQQNKEFEGGSFQASVCRRCRMFRKKKKHG